MNIELLGQEPQDDDAICAARYRWLRDGNAYVPEECGVTGGEALDRLCDDGIYEQEHPRTQEDRERAEAAYRLAMSEHAKQLIAEMAARLSKETQ